MTQDERHVELLKVQYHQIHKILSAVRITLHQAIDVMDKVKFAVPSDITERNPYKFAQHVTMTSARYEEVLAIEEFFKEIRTLLR